jgi:hypothetical protein
MYPRIPCELVANHGSAEHTFGISCFAVPKHALGFHPLHCTVRTGDPTGLERLGCEAGHICLLVMLTTHGAIFPFSPQSSSDYAAEVLPCSQEPTPVTILSQINPLNAELNPICHLLVLLGAHHILHISRLRVNAIHTVQPGCLNLLAPELFF